MGLLDLQTNLKDYKFGQAPMSDRRGGGNSDQPYIKNPIDKSIIPQSTDFLLRGGLNAPLDAGVDVLRLTKFFGDLKSPRGILFVAKQNILSRIGVRTQASPVGLNEGAYTPLSTLAQAGIGFAGSHVYKQGLNPLKGVKTYSEIIKEQRNQNLNVDFINSQVLSNLNPDLSQYGSRFSPQNEVGKEEYNNRLYGLYKTKIVKEPTYRYSKSNSISLFDGETLRYGGGPNSLLGIGNTKLKLHSNDNKPNWEKGNNTVTWSSKQLFSQSHVRGARSLQDFRKPLLEDATTKAKSKIIMGFSPSYSPAESKTYEGGDGSRVGITSPGISKDRSDYSTPYSASVDKINASSIYTKDKGEGANEINDLVKFRIAALNRDGSKTYMHFRAFINSFSDTYGAAWDSISYMGRGEDLYKYSKFSRNISVGFTVAAQSKGELIPQYKKLNYLASTLAPDYGTKGYMGGVITTLTLGGWLYEQPGFITSLSLTPPQESPWEIGIDTKGNNDSKVKELPHIINVEMAFTPIHQFIPEYQNKLENGPSRFIALETDGNSTNYVKKETTDTGGSRASGFGNSIVE